MQSIDGCVRMAWFSLSLSLSLSVSLSLCLPFPLSLFVSPFFASTLSFFCLSLCLFYSSFYTFFLLFSLPLSFCQEMCFIISCQRFENQPILIFYSCFKMHAPVSPYHAYFIFQPLQAQAAKLGTIFKTHSFFLVICLCRNLSNWLLRKYMDLNPRHFNQ